MNYKDTLLYSSLIQVSSISSKKEEQYWKNGIFTLDDLYQSLNQQLSFFDNNSFDEINEIISNRFQNIDKIAEIFERKTGKKDLYRIAYSIPNDVVFLDIETTGLSHIYHYITMIGWIKNGKYDYWLVGTNPNRFFEVIRNAKMIITFNGQRFDLKFIDLLFPELNIREKPHLDLCPFCRRFGLTGGQKEIEKNVGYIRPDQIHDCDGKEAVILWYRFLFGESDALDSLILYNCYDVCGMMYILDHVFFHLIFGKIFPKIGKPNNFFKNYCSPKTYTTEAVNNKIRRKINSNIFDIKQLKESSKHCIVGIDLAGVVKKTSHTGIAVLQDDLATTKVVTYDDDIISFIKQYHPDIISIDAPLSLPNGRTSVYDDDPMRDEYGITRYCERELKRRGVSAYPALIRSMQELTKRGINLSSKLRKMGYPVIECFPGAAQDILQIPRKRTDPNLLKYGLSRIGIHGDFETKKVIHDELDAITAALVAKFFIDGYYEPIGIPEENDMIVPSVNSRKRKYEMVIGITGNIAAGKTTAAEYLKHQHNFSYCRYSQILSERLLANDTIVNRESLQEIGKTIFSEDSQYELNKCVSSKVYGNAFVVIDGMRHFEDYTFWKENCFSKFYLIYIDTDKEVCAERYSVDKYDQYINHTAEKEIKSLRELADFVIDNNSTIDSLYSAIDGMLADLNI